MNSSDEPSLRESSRPVSFDMWRLSPAERADALEQCRQQAATLRDFVIERFPGAHVDDGGTVYIDGGYHDGERARRVAVEFMSGERLFVVRSGCNYYVGEASPAEYRVTALFHDEGYGGVPDRTYRCNEVWSVRQFLASSEPHHVALKAELTAVLASTRKDGSSPKSSTPEP